MAKGRTPKLINGFGESKTLTEWAADARNIHNIKFGTIAWRLKDGWTIEEALSKANGERRKPREPKIVTTENPNTDRVRTNNLEWNDTEKRILLILRERNTDSGEYRREIINMRKLTFADGYNSGPHKPEALLAWLLDNPKEASLTAFDKTCFECHNF